ncbi:hypothetical protein GCM10023094_09320 [Rhodococcus olei]|uniref:Uncharacterized protein n=1 Tax=Rhodococcus olei TaxID=2161675 RepID=A0ABP8NYR1_9NOCA
MATNVSTVLTPIAGISTITINTSCAAPASRTSIAASRPSDTRAWLAGRAYFHKLVADAK